MLAEIISPEGFMIVQLPGLFYIHRTYGKPIRYFQNAHVYNYYSYHLKAFFETLGLKVIYSDETCTFLIKKPASWQKKNTDGLTVWDKEMPEWSRKIGDALKKYYVLSIFDRVNPYRRIRRCAVKLLELAGIKDTVKKLIGRK